ncbi:hypothetical protein JHK82_043086 [Glycine max]|nr:hypothetical protein JHK82_043086 [Glycine max]
MQKRIAATDANASGQIPPSVGDLPYLESITFHKLPNLVGPIQPTIAKLTKLKSLFITYTNISGPIPAFLGQLKNLELIKLSFNNLSGPIPNCLISGPIPASLGNLNPDRVDLSRNKLEGDASMLFSSKKTTQILDLSRNKFEFDLSHLTFPKQSLIWLDLNHNNIYGNIPVALTTVKYLQQFNVSYNPRLSGKIPQGGELQRFDKYAYFHTKLCGSPLPPCK